MTLFPIVQKGKWGFINSDGSIVVSPQFDSAMTCTEGLAAIKRNGKWGFINESGDVVIAPRFDQCHAFAHGLALVEEGEWKQYIDPTGEVVIRTKFYECSSFEGDLAPVNPDMLSTGSFIDRTGEVVLTGCNYHVSHYSSGLINCREGKQWGFRNRAGEFVIPPRYKHARPFCEGLAAVVAGKGNRYSFIDTRGNVAIEGRFQGSDIGFSDDLCAVWDRRYGYIDRQGNLAIPYRFYLGQHFAEGLAVVQVHDSDPFGYVNAAGEIVIRPAYTFAEPFSGGLAQVIVGDDVASFRYGYIDQRGEYVWQPSC